MNAFTKLFLPVVFGLGASIAFGPSARAATGADLTPGARVSGRITALGQTNLHRLTATSNDVIYVMAVLTDGPGTWPAMALSDPDGVVVTTGLSAPGFVYTGNLRVAKSGTYTLALFDGGLDESFGYVVSFNLARCGVNQREPGDGPEMIDPGRFSYGHIDLADYDTFCFSAASNDVVYVTALLTNGPGTWPGMYLYDPDGVLLTTGLNAPGFVYTGNLRVGKTGTYTVAMLDGGLDESFDYVVSCNLARCGINEREAGDGPEALIAGQFSHGHMEPADYDTFCLDAVSNDVIYVTALLTNGPGSWPGMYVYDPDGVLLTTGLNAPGFVYTGNLRVSKTGRYTIALIDGGLDESFDYILSGNVAGCGVNEREPGDGPEELALGRFSHGHMEPADYDTFCFRASSNEVIYVTALLTNGPGSWPGMYLYDPEGVLVTTGLNAPNYVYTGSLRLAKTGVYTVAVIDGGLEESFDYVISGVKVPGPNATDPGDGPSSLQAGEVRRAHLSVGDFDAYQIDAIAGDTLKVALRRTSGPGQYPVVEIYGPDARLLQSAFALTLVRIEVPCVAQTGAYTVVIYDDGLNEDYDYELAFEQSPVVPASEGLTQFLAICDCTNRVVVRWAAGAQALGFELETNPLVDGLSFSEWMASGSWSPVAGPFAVAGDYVFFTQPPTSASGYYRLKRGGQSGAAATAAPGR